MFFPLSLVADQSALSGCTQAHEARAALSRVLELASPSKESKTCRAATLRTDSSCTLSPLFSHDQFPCTRFGDSAPVTSVSSVPRTVCSASLSLSCKTCTKDCQDAVPGHAGRTLCCLPPDLCLSPFLTNLYISQEDSFFLLSPSYCPCYNEKRKANFDKLHITATTVTSF